MKTSNGKEGKGFQKTIKKQVLFSGKALQSGKKSSMICNPAAGQKGIIFRRSDLAGTPGIKAGDVMLLPGAARRSIIGSGKVQVQTIEHFMAALWALGIDNVEVEVDGPELPAMDGSAAGFLGPLKEAGTESQRYKREYIKIEKEIEVRSDSAGISVSPSEKFSVSYLIDYGVRCIKKERFEIELDGDVFEKEIAPARTFCLKKEAILLLVSGMGRGANFKNALVLGGKGPVGTSFRFPNEPVRHKVLDIVGDLYMLGRPILGKVSAELSGHALNAMLVRKIYEEYIKQPKDE